MQQLSEQASFSSNHAPSKIPTRAQNPALVTPVCAQLKTMHEDAFNKIKTAVLATLPYKYVPFMLSFRNKKIVVCPFAVLNWSEMLTPRAPSAARRPNVTALPGASGADAAATLSPCKDTRIMWHRLNDSQPRGHSGPRDHASSSTSVHKWPQSDFRVKVQTPTPRIQWISMWTCEDKSRASGEQSSYLQQLIFVLTGSAGAFPSSHWKYRLDRKHTI